MSEPSRTGFLWTIVRRPVAVLMVVIAVAVFGGVSLTRMQVNLLPDVSYPSLTVRTEYEGAAPIDVEKLITRKLEEQLAVISNLVSYRSISRAGVSDVILEFEWDTPMTFAMQDVREKVAQLKSQLPDRVSEPLLLRYDPTLDPIMRVAIYEPDHAEAGDHLFPAVSTGMFKDHIQQNQRGDRFGNHTDGRNGGPVTPPVGCGARFPFCGIKPGKGLTLGGDGFAVEQNTQRHAIAHSTLHTALMVASSFPGVLRIKSVQNLLTGLRGQQGRIPEPHADHAGDGQEGAPQTHIQTQVGFHPASQTRRQPGGQNPNGASQCGSRSAKTFQFLVDVRFLFLQGSEYAGYALLTKPVQIRVSSGRIAKFQRAQGLDKPENLNPEMLEGLTCQGTESCPENRLPTAGPLGNGHPGWPAEFQHSRVVCMSRTCHRGLGFTFPVPGSTVGDFQHQGGSGGLTLIDTTHETKFIFFNQA